MGSALYNIIITPLEIFIELVFKVTKEIFSNNGISIIFVSIAVQILSFPLYKKADDIQEEERQKQKAMKPWVTHIKKTFKGDERFMMQQTYYREVGYKPIYAVKGSLSLFFQIPFFIAAYNFLSNLQSLNGVSFLGIADLSKPDGLIHIGAITLNLLPILMTLFNVISGIIYTKGMPVKDKVQTYGLAAIFLVILYKSPSALVFYWTLNNLFSLLKNILLKIVKNPGRMVRIILVLAGIAMPLYCFTLLNPSRKVSIIVIAASVACFIPAVVSVILRNRKDKISLLTEKDSAVNLKTVNAVFYFSCGAALLLLGLLIPVNVIKSSPVEFKSENYGPYGLIFNTFCVYAGLIFLWLNVFYIFSPAKIRKVFAVLMSIFASAGIVNYMFFAKNLGTMSPSFVYDVYPEFAKKEILINILVMLVTAAAVFFIYIKKAEIVKRIQQILCLTLSVLIVIGSVSIEKTLIFEESAQNSETVKSEKIVSLSRKGKNVIVFMLDRAISGYIPFIMEDNPQLKEVFDGFTYYPNTVSFGQCTNFCTPSLFGGYEYTPTEMNKRDTELLVDKHNEALSVLPKLFTDNGYAVSVVDPPYINYRWTQDLSIYDKYEGVSAYAASGKYSDESIKSYTELFEKTQKSSAVSYSLMKAFPVALQNTVYRRGFYWSTSSFVDKVSVFLEKYTVLQKLSELTEITDDATNCFTMMQNSSTHEPLFFDLENDMPLTITHVDPLEARTLPDGTVMKLSEKDHITHFQTNTAALLKVAAWLNFMKEQGVYDNTKIIIVADHGRDLNQFNTMVFDNGLDVECYNPLLLVKDFNAKGFKTSDEFMTIADVPTLAVSNVIENPVNPFTGKPISDSEKTAHPQVLTTSYLCEIKENNGKQFNTSDGEWWSVHDNIFDEKNWKKAEDNK